MLRMTKAESAPKSRRATVTPINTMPAFLASAADSARAWVAQS